MFTSEGEWKLAANINPCDGQNFGYGGPWSKGKDVGTLSESLTKDYVKDEIWKTTAKYITIARHENGKCTMSKTWEFSDKTKSLYKYFSTYPGRINATGDGSYKDTHISSDMPDTADGLSGTWKDPIFGADGGLVLNWYYSNNGARIAVPGGYKVPFSLPGTGENNDDLHGLGNEFGASTNLGHGSTAWWHDVAMIGPDCHGGSCAVVGTDHGTDLMGDPMTCWGSYAIYIDCAIFSINCTYLCLILIPT